MEDEDGDFDSCPNCDPELTPDDGEETSGSGSMKKKTSGSGSTTEWPSAKRAKQ